MSVVIDVTQFCRQPARSGVQRALGEMARAWPVGHDAVFAARTRDGVRTLPPATFADLVKRHFASSDAHRGAPEVAGAFAAGRRLGDAHLNGAVLLLPEPTYDPEILDDLVHRVRRGQPVAGVAYDCFPQTHPWAFAGNGQVLTSPYYRLLAALPLVIATSVYVHGVLVDRLRRPVGTTVTHWLGTDHVGGDRGAGERAEADFLVVGTVEPRKRLPLAVAAVDVLRETTPNARLVLIGRPGVEEPAFLRQLRQRTAGRDGLSWIEEADDRTLTEAMQRTTVLLALGDEGYGLPAVEAVSHGACVVYGGEQPAAELLEGRGAWRADISSPAALADALRPWLNLEVAERQRSQIDMTGLPTWRAFSQDLSTSLAGLA